MENNNIGSAANRYADYRKRAEEAERLARVATNETARESFRLVASGWRHLARQAKLAMKKHF